MIFPFMDEEEIEVVEDEVPLAREYAYDFKEGDFKRKNGKLYIVEGNKAIKIWIHKALITSRYKEIIHTWNYGSEFEDKIIGKSYSAGLIEAEAKRYTIECIEAALGDYVIELKDFNISFREGVLGIDFAAVTIYGEVSVIV